MTVVYEDDLIRVECVPRGLKMIGVDGIDYSDLTWRDVLDGFLCNGAEEIGAEEIGALTDAPIVAYDGSIYWFEAYAVVDEQEAWNAGRSVYFVYGGAYEEGEDNE